MICAVQGNTVTKSHTSAKQLRICVNFPFHTRPVWELQPEPLIVKWPVPSTVPYYLRYEAPIICDWKSGEFHRYEKTTLLELPVL